jgi:hypothetical protein
MITTSNVKNDKSNNFKLEQNYPNPFNSKTVIQFTLPQSESVKINIYNVLGEAIQKLLDNNLQQGTYFVLFDATNLPAGVYYYSINSNNFSIHKSMLLIK